MKKVIGVMPLWDTEKDSIWMLPGYLEGVEQAGGLPLIFPLLSAREDILQLCRLCDGFVFTGGQDVNPALYMEERMAQTDELCETRDEMEKIVLDYALSQDKAVLGICRGLQFLNVTLGGSLYQDLPAQTSSGITHRMSAPYDQVCHTVHLCPDTPLFHLLQMPVLGVNSCHHQGIRIPAPGLTVMARAEDGLAEAVCLESRRFVWAVQWHPEFSWRSDSSSRLIFQSFIDHC